MSRSILFLATLFISTPAFAGTDADGDGYEVDATDPAQKDCDDGNTEVYPGAAEVVEASGPQIDNDCNPSTPMADPAAAPDTCPTGQHAVTSTKCEPDAPTVDAEAKACAEGKKDHSVAYYTSVHAACVAAAPNCTWYGFSETDKDKQCHGVEAEGYTWSGGKVVSIGQAAEAHAQQARAAAARAQAQIGGLRQDLREEAAARIAAIRDLQTEVDQIAAELETKADKAEVEALAERQTAAQRKLEELTLRIGGPGGLEAVQAQLVSNDQVITRRLAALEATVSRHSGEIDELQKRGAVYVRVEARATIAGQTAIMHRFTDFDADGDKVGDFTRLARGSFMGGGGLNFVIGGDFGVFRTGLLIQVDVGGEQGDSPNGERQWFAGLSPALGVEVLADIDEQLSLGGAVGYAYHATDPSSLGGSRVSQNSARVQGTINWRPDVRGKGFSLTVNPFFDAGNCGGVGYGEQGEEVTAQGTCLGGGFAVGAGFAF